MSSRLLRTVRSCARPVLWGPVLLGLLSVPAPSGAQAPVNVREVSEAGVTYLDLSNDFISLRLEPGRGGRIVSFRPAFSGAEWRHPEPSFGMALDHFAGQGHPGELDKVAYDYRLLQEPQEQGVELWATTREGRLGVPVGVKVTKRLTLRPGSPVIRVIYTLTNTTTATVRLGFMPKFDLYVSGEPEENYYFRPTTRGLSIAHAEPDSVCGQDWVSDPLEGWTVALNRRTGEGLALLMDYNYLHRLYNCIAYHTVEWLYDRVSLQAGGSWSSEVRLIPFSGLRQVCHVSPRLLADVQVTEHDGNVAIAHHLRATEGELSDLIISTAVTQIASLREYAFPEARLGRLGTDLTTATVEAQINEHSGLTVTVTVSGRGDDGRDFTERYDYYYRGREGGGFDLIASAERGYFKPAPRKVKQFAQPPTVAFLPARPPEIFEMRGLFGNLYRLRQGAARAGMKVTGQAYASLSWDGPSVDYFPFDFSELFNFSVVVINNLDADALDDEMQYMLAEYVKAGGGLLVLGGYYGFGLGGWDRSARLSEILPVKIVGSFDLQPVTGSGTLGDGPGSLYQQAHFSMAGEVAWLHRLAPKPAAEVQAWAGSLPFIVTGSYGQGRVAAIGGTVLGQPVGTGGVLFWRTRAWQDNLARLLSWLAGPEQPT